MCSCTPLALNRREQQTKRNQDQRHHAQNGEYVDIGQEARLLNHGLVHAPGGNAGRVADLSGKVLDRLRAFADRLLELLVKRRGVVRKVRAVGLRALGDETPSKAICQSGPQRYGTW